MATDFETIREAAVIRHGSAAVEQRLSQPATPEELRRRGDAYYLSLMSLRIFRAGLKHSLVDAKWPAFEAAFAGFEPDTCAALPDEAIEAMLENKALIRNLPKLRTVRANAAAMLQIRAEHGSMGAWLADWPEEDIVGLWDELAKRFQQMGGMSAPAFLRMAGKDTFMLTTSVLGGLVHWGELEREPKGKAERRAMGLVFARWRAETGLPLCQLSQILALSTD